MGGRRRGLGRGLEALLGEAAAEARPAEVGVEEIEPNPHQPRRRFGQAELEELADSIREHGVVQPVVVRPVGGRYQLVAGERRWRAARLAGLDRIPAVVREVPDERLLEVALIENIQREDLTPLEEARAYEALLRHLGCTQEELATRLGRSRAAVTNTLRLLQLDPEVQDLIESRRLTEGHGRALLGLPDRSAQRELARVMAEKGLSVRQAEAAVRAAVRRGPGRAVPVAGRAGGGGAAGAAVRHMEEELRRRLAAPVRIRRGAESGGSIEIVFFGEEDLARICDVLLGREGGAGGGL